MMKESGTNGKKSETQTGKPDQLVMGFVPSQDSDTIADTVEPLAKRLSEELDIEVKGEVMTNYNALVKAMGANQGAYWLYPCIWLYPC